MLAVYVVTTELLGAFWCALQVMERVVCFSLVVGEELEEVAVEAAVQAFLRFPSARKLTITITITISIPHFL